MWQDAKMDRDRRGAVEIESTVLYSDKFAFYTSTGRFFECMADSPDVRPSLISLAIYILS